MAGQRAGGGGEQTGRGDVGSDATVKAGMEKLMRDTRAAARNGDEPHAP